MELAELDWMRFFTALLTGFLLSFAGTLVQITTRNELASPSTLGMDGLAVLLIIISFVFQSVGIDFSLSQMALVIGGGGAIVIWFFGAQLLRSNDLRLVLLLGLSINLFVGALFSIMQFLAIGFNLKFPEQIWFGRLTTLNTSGTLSAAVLMIIVLSFILFYRKSWKILLLGRGWCHGLGVPIDKMLRASLVISFLITLWIVVHFGVFGFLGLLFPLVLRQFPRYKGEPWREMTDGAFISGLFFAFLDQLCFQFTFYGSEVPVGLPAGLFGASALVILLWKRNIKG
jgi:ABC-type Fe3+-siderophore transport system permease subunit